MTTWSQATDQCHRCLQGRGRLHRQDGTRLAASPLNAPKDWDDNHDFDQDGYNDSHDNDEDAVSDASKSSIAKAIEHVYVLEHKTFALAIYRD